MFPSSFNKPVQSGYKARLRWVTSQLFPPLVPVVRPDKEDSSCHKERGNLRLHAGRGSPHPSCLHPSTLPTTPFKGVPQEPLCQQAAGGVRRTAESLACLHLVHKYKNTQTSPRSSLTSTSQSHAYSHTCVYTCLAISSWTLLFKLEHELIVHISLAPDCGWPVSSTDTFHFVRLRQR